MYIAKAKLNDFAAILKLQYIAYESEAIRYNDFNIPPLTQTLEQLIKEDENSTILKATQGESIIGSVRGASHAGTCKIGRLIVHPDFQCQGIGSQLLSDIEQHFPEVETFELFTGSDSNDNIRLYKKFGYSEFKRKKLTEEIDLIYLHKKNKAFDKKN